MIVTIKYGANVQSIQYACNVAAARVLMNAGDASAFVNVNPAPESFILRDRDTLEFIDAPKAEETKPALDVPAEPEKKEEPK